MTTLSPSNSDTAVFTGERFLLSEPGPIRLEHLHRYSAVCRVLSPRMTVLDIACGEGYGSALMAGFADTIIGVDIDPETIDHATQRYAGVRTLSGKPIEYRVGDCSAIPIEESSVDLLVSFETLEHHDRHEEMMSEARRVLRPDGLLILSSPSRAIYTEAAGYTNPFHVKELDRNELVALLSKTFPALRLLGQATQIGSFLFPETRGADPLLLPDGTRCDVVAGKIMIEEQGGAPSTLAHRSARYFVAVAGRDEAVVASASERLTSAYLDPLDSTMTRIEAAYQDVLAEARTLQSYVAELEAGHRRIEDELRAAMTERQQIVAERAAVIADRDAVRARLEKIEAQMTFRFARAAGVIKDGQK